MSDIPAFAFASSATSLNHEYRWPKKPRRPRRRSHGALSRGADGRYGLSFGGDTFNTAVYLARAGIDAAYATALSDDPYSDKLFALAAAETINTELIVRVPGRMPGLYLIETDDKGERRFFYWRDTSPARELFEVPDWSRVAQALLWRGWLFLRRDAVALFHAGLGRFLAALEVARANKVLVRSTATSATRLKGDLARTRTVCAERSSASISRCRPSTTRRAVGRRNPEATGRAAAGLRHRRDRGQERAEQRAVAHGTDASTWVPNVVVPVRHHGAGDSFMPPIWPGGSGAAPSSPRAPPMLLAGSDPPSRRHHAARHGAMH